MTGLIKKAVLGGALAVSTLVAVAPAEAQYYRDRRHRGGDAAGAAIVGGIIGLGLGAAIASSGNRGGYYDRGYYNGGPRGYYNNSYNNYYQQPYSYYNQHDYQQRCWTERRYDPYVGRRVRVRICQ
ncbi:MAG: hypothetical protein JWN21_207 [Sphingomonas bacterium]|uniref:hypothetical protein n=1 Tax=Sphingomonas bacterium TaxID=1895847 RepID=UPI0026142C3E|nr:hypothetical protein [Sphingomonas bacterium]MDB5694664.1 hypothetical protein [Sphingomonas bacterium]